MTQSPKEPAAPQHLLLPLPPREPEGTKSKHHETFTHTNSSSSENPQTPLLFLLHFPAPIMQNPTRTTITQFNFLSLLLLLPLLHSHSPGALSRSPTSPLLPDAVSLLSFKAQADLDNRLFFALNERFDYCQWQGVRCVQGRVVRLALPSSRLRGFFPSNSLTRLDQLRVIILKNNSLSGPIPDLSPLVNLKSLVLDRNSFSGPFPSSVTSLHRVRVLDLSQNNLTGSIPPELVRLDRLVSLRLESNRLIGTIPPLNQSSLQIFNVSGNNLTGPIPVTSALLRFQPSSFSQNPNLCGEIVNRECGSRRPFFDSSPPPSSPNAQSQGVLHSPPAPEEEKHHKRIRTSMVIGVCIGCSVVILSLLIYFVFPKQEKSGSNNVSADKIEAPRAEENRLEEGGEVGIQRGRRSGDLVFCERETEVFSLEQLMRASAELLGRGTIGATYKAVIDHRLTVSVKRLDTGKTAITSGEAFERHMEAVGGLRHPNLVPVRAYFEAKEERLVVYDYQPNGSLLSLIHGSRSTRARPLHWTSCLKIAEDVAQGLAYIHQASRLVHGNLKSSNVLLGSDFEACLTDYCLAVLSDSSSTDDDPDTARYSAPETRKCTQQATFRSDVYAFGILLLEILTGKPPAQLPFLPPTDWPNWVQAVRKDDGSEDNRLGLLIEVASVCSLTSPEQRPTMRQVLKMIEEIKESLVDEDDNASFGTS